MRSTLHVLLIRPSKYDDEGYVVRFARGVLPSNTLATMAGLTRTAIESGELGDAAVEVASRAASRPKGPHAAAGWPLRRAVQPVRESN